MGGYLGVMPNWGFFGEVRVGCWGGGLVQVDNPFGHVVVLGLLGLGLGLGLTLVGLAMVGCLLVVLEGSMEVLEGVEGLGELPAGTFG